MKITLPPTVLSCNSAVSVNVAVIADSREQPISCAVARSSQADCMQLCRIPLTSVGICIILLCYIIAVLGIAQNYHCFLCSPLILTLRVLWDNVHNFTITM